MSLALAHHLGSGTLPDVNADSEAFEKKLPRPAHLLPIPASSQPPLHFFSCDTPLETASVPNVSNVGSNPGHSAYTFDDFAHRDRDDYNGDSGFSGASINGYDDGQGSTLDEPSPRFHTYGTIYTDDARMKLGDCIRRQCFNCRATETTTWRRSRLSPGKMLCNKCGLFERTHAVPRPKTFPRRRRSQPPSVNRSLNPPSDFDGRRNYYNCPSIMPYTGLPLYATRPSETSPDMSWMSYNMPDVSSASPGVSPCHINTPKPTRYRADFQLPL